MIRDLMFVYIGSAISFMIIRCQMMSFEFFLLRFMVE